MSERKRRFDAIVVPHLSAAFNLARWLLKNDMDAQDVVQESFLRAFRFFDALKGEDARPWLLGIVRNSCYSWMREQGRHDQLEFDEERDHDAIDPTHALEGKDPERLLELRQDACQLNEAIDALAPQYREMIVLREIEEMSYEEISTVLSIPMGTVMSRLARARAMLRKALTRANRERQR